MAPDLSAGMPSDPATRAGRALALQLIGVALALRRRPVARADRGRSAAGLAGRRGGTGGARDRARSRSGGRSSRLTRSRSSSRRPRLRASSGGSSRRPRPCTPATSRSSWVVSIRPMANASSAVATLRAGSSVGQGGRGRHGAGCPDRVGPGPCPGGGQGRGRHPRRACRPGLADGRRRPARRRVDHVPRRRDGRRADRGVRSVRAGARSARLVVAASHLRVSRRRPPGSRG